MADTYTMGIWFQGLMRCKCDMGAAIQSYCNPELLSVAAAPISTPSKPVAVQMERFACLITMGVEGTFATGCM